jgi:hypothetical protein
MKEYVTVPDALLKNTKALQKHLAVSYLREDVEAETVQEEAVISESS